MAPDARDALLSVAQAATLLGVHPNTIRSWTDAGRLTAYRINTRGDRRFRRDDVERLLVEEAPSSTAAEASVAAGRPGRDAELGLFERLASGLVSRPSPATVARAAIEALRTDGGAARVAVYVAGDGGVELVAHAGFAAPPPPIVAAEDDAVSELSDGLRAVPLRAASGITGVLVVDRVAADRMPTALLRAVAATLASSLLTAQRIARVRRELGRARALRSVTKELTGTLDLSSLLTEVVGLTHSLFEADMAGLWLVEEASETFVTAAHHGLSADFLQQVEGLTTRADTLGTRAIRDRRAYWMRDAGVEAVGAMSATYATEGVQTACLVPLIGGDRAFGLLGLYHRRDHAWPEDEVALLQAFADQAAVAIQNARLYRSLAMQATRLQSIQDLSARLNRLTDVRAIAEAIVAEATTLAEYHDIRVYQVDWDRRVCEPIAFTRQMLEGDPADAERLLRVEIGEGFTGWVAEHAEPLLINDAIDDERGKTIEGTEDIPESMLIVPMLYEGRAIGVIVLSQLGFNRFTADDLQTMSIFAGYAAQAMANATTYRQLVERSAELARRAESQRHLLETSGRLLGTLDQADVLTTIADGLRDVVDYDNLSIYRTDPIRRVMQPVLTRELHADEVSRFVVPIGQGLMGWAVEHAEPILANDALQDPRAMQVPGTPPDPEAVVVVPLIADGEVLGAMNASRVGREEVHFTESDFELIQLFAAQAAIALRNADAHHAVSQRAETDALTGLGNHGAFQHELAHLIDGIAAKAADAPESVAVLMMDLDSFKAYNDRYGHPSGDALLHEAATAITAAARSTDRVFRYGGDEFALILPGAAVADAARVAERIRGAVSALTAADASPVTITIGVAGLPEDAVDRAGLIEAADTALYYGKRAGENRIVVAGELPSDVVDLRGTLDDLARAALRDGDDPHAVEHLVERASQLSGALHGEAPDAAGEALLAVARAFAASELGPATAPADEGHGDRVGRLAARVAGRLGMPRDEQRGLELAGRLHGLADRAIAELGAVASLRPVAALIAGQRSLVAEGARRGRRGARARGPLGPHVLEAANAYDALVSGGGEDRLGRAEAIAELRRSPTTFRSDVLAAFAAVVGDRADGGQRHRSSDATGEERGAA